MKEISERHVTFEAGDGYRLHGTLIRPEKPSRSVLISSGTGFPQSYYLRCARYFAEKGASVLVFDYRGIGASAPADLSRMAMDYTDFGRLDLPAAASFLADADRGGNIVHLAHSVGGHMVGFMPNHDLITRHSFVAVGSGYWLKHKLWYMPLALTFWWLLGPYELMRHGHIRRSKVWRGEPLPAGVFKTWRRWCAKSGYYAEELKEQLRPHHFEEVSAPIKSWVYSDDPIAGRETSQAILSCYPNATKEIVESKPADFGKRKIGHDGMFRKDMEPLWAEWWDWLAA